MSGYLSCRKDIEEASRDDDMEIDEDDPFTALESSNEVKL